jgi:hypothetical protein
MSNTIIDITVIPHGVTKPIITYGIDDCSINTLGLKEATTLNFCTDLSKGEHTIFIEFVNKTNFTPDLAIEISSVTIEGMTMDRFKWAGKYYPKYPEPWASAQQDLPKVRDAMTYLGWNGRWTLTFSVPIFQWIHKVEHLGWIYI